MEMFGHVLVGRAVATQGNAACLAGSQVHPVIAGFNALLAYLVFRLLHSFYVRDVLAKLSWFHRINLSISNNKYESLKVASKPIC